MSLANKSFYTLIKLKLRDGTGRFEALTKATLVIHWPNLYTSHSLRALLQCNHQLLILPYFKLLFELRSYCCLRTDNHHSPNKRNGMLHQPAFIKVPLRAGISSFRNLELPTVVRSTIPAQLFVWITESSKSILSIQSFY